jgi:hypothetical protein
METDKSHIFSSRFILTVLLSAYLLLLTAQTITDDSLPQYLFPEFAMGIVKMKNGSNQRVLMNYNTLTETMVFKQNGILMDMTNLDGIDTISLQNAKFVPAAKVFYEVLVNAPVSLFVQHKSELKSTGRPAAYGTKSQTTGPTSLSKLYTHNRSYNLKLPEDFKVSHSSVNWIRINGIMHKFLTERQFLKIFPGRENDIQKIISQTNLDIKNKNDLINLVNYCNELIK